MVLFAVIPISENMGPSWLEDLIPEGSAFLPDDRKCYIGLQTCAANWAHCTLYVQRITQEEEAVLARVFYPDQLGEVWLLSTVSREENVWDSGHPPGSVLFSIYQLGLQMDECSMNGPRKVCLSETLFVQEGEFEYYHQVSQWT